MNERIQKLIQEFCMEPYMTDQFTVEFRINHAKAETLRLLVQTIMDEVRPMPVNKPVVLNGVGPVILTNAGESKEP